jgi:inner membrane protein
LDIITHTLSGVLVGATVASSAISTKAKINIILVGALGGCLPDIDAISLWSGFDDTFGKIFNLNHAGHEIYFSKFWYSHHGFFHSIAAIIVYLLLYVTVMKMDAIMAKQSTNVNYHAFVAFSGGYLAHILKDLPTPSGSWGGINLFWPSSEWIGGTGQTWWWNNYDIFLIVLVSCTINIIMAFWNTKWKKTVSITILSMAFFMIIFQINNRHFDFNASGYGAKESISLDIQREILGEKLFDFMVKLDNKIKINF